jgi:hypothetical protein
LGEGALEAIFAEGLWDGFLDEGRAMESFFDGDPVEKGDWAIA